MEGWVGPAIIAAFISGLISLLVVQLNFRQERKADRHRREEKVRDFQIALRAEIRSELHNLQQYDVDAVVAEVKQRYDSDPNYVASVPRITKHIVFDAIAKEIHVLPEDVIDPVVLYARQRQAVEQLIEDMRDPEFKSIARNRQVAMLEDYLKMWIIWRDLAAAAEKALDSASDSINRTRTRLTGNRLDGR